MFTKDYKPYNAQDEIDETESKPIKDALQGKIDDYFKKTGSVFKEGIDFSKDLIPEPDDTFFQVDNYNEINNLCDCSFEFQDNTLEIMPALQSFIRECDEDISMEYTDVYATLLSLSADDEVKFELNLTLGDDTTVWITVPLNENEQDSLTDVLKGYRESELDKDPQILDAFKDDYDR